jgi:hypothetical protein
MVLMKFLKILQNYFKIFNLDTFHNFQIEHNTRIKNLKIYEEFPQLDKQRTPIKYKIVKIQIGSNPSHTITRIQFPIQLAAACTIHRS